MGLLVCLFVVCCYAKLKINGVVLVSYQQTNETNRAMVQDAFSIVGRGGWVSLVVQFTQSNINSTSIVSADNLSLLEETVKTAKGLGLNVVVKPHVDLSEDPLHWRGEIGKYFDSASWELWFQSYKSVVVKTVAASCRGADALNIGTELTLTQSREQNWRDVISFARSVFPGILTYGANHNDEASINWWDALDWIGIDAYYPLGNDSSVAALEQSSTLLWFCSVWRPETTCCK